jgi:hypothetical protein
MPTIRPGGQPSVVDGWAGQTIGLSIRTAEGRNPPPTVMEMVGYARTPCPLPRLPPRAREPTYGL